MIAPELLIKISKWASDHQEIKKVYIFGSRAKGTYRKNSDIDIAIELDETYIKEDALTSWMYLSSSFKANLSVILLYEIDLQQYHAEYCPFVFSYVNSCSIVAYEKYAKQF